MFVMVGVNVGVDVGVGVLVAVFVGVIDAVIVAVGGSIAARFELTSGADVGVWVQAE